MVGVVTGNKNSNGSKSLNLQTDTDDLENDEGYIWNEEANISVNIADRSIFVYGWDEETYQDLSVLYRMFKDGILDEIEV